MSDDVCPSGGTSSGYKSHFVWILLRSCLLNIRHCSCVILCIFWFRCLKQLPQESIWPQEASWSEVKKNCGNSFFKKNLNNKVIILCCFFFFSLQERKTSCHRHTWLWDLDFSSRLLSSTLLLYSFHPPLCYICYYLSPIFGDFWFSPGLRLKVNVFAFLLVPSAGGWNECVPTQGGEKGEDCGGRYGGWEVQNCWTAGGRRGARRWEDTGGHKGVDLECSVVDHCPRVWHHLLLLRQVTTAVMRIREKELQEEMERWWKR